jgi:SAM-dependent methyltransferase
MITRKSTPEEIRQRFDRDVERFSNLETGQSATVDAPLGLELIVGAATAVNPAAATLLDIGCGAGNYTLKMLQSLPLRSVMLVDLSKPMLDRAVQRIRAADTELDITAVQADTAIPPCRGIRSMSRWRQRRFTTCAEMLNGRVSSVRFTDRSRLADRSGSGTW